MNLQLLNVKDVLGSTVTWMGKTRNAYTVLDENVQEKSKLVEDLCIHSRILMKVLES
jgi:hypothetical protein